MPRDIPIGNGSLLAAFDANYQIRDLYWPHVGQENHAGGHPFRLGVWADGAFRWIDDGGWKRDLRYANETLVSDVTLSHPELQLELRVMDAVDFHEDLLVRRFDVRDRAGRKRDVRLFFHHDFHIAGNEVGDTAYYEPDRRAVCHYKGGRWFLANGAIAVSGEAAGPEWTPTEDTTPGLQVGVQQWACGLKEIHSLQGTWRDAEDGELSGSSVAHGSVDSCIGFTVQVPARGERTVYYWLAAGEDFETVAGINRSVRRRGPEHFLRRTQEYWRLWLATHRPAFDGLPEPVGAQYLRSLLTIRTQADAGGAILAANDTDISYSVRDTYSYMWPRDGALIANALSQAGYIDLPRRFFEFCSRVIAREGFLLHKYNPDGTLASSWHPWYREGQKSVPLQEDETALVVWALGEHFRRFGDVEFVKPLYRRLVIAASDFMVQHTDVKTGLPLPSYDLWEERWGVLGWTVAATWAGLMSAADFAKAFGDTEREARYRHAADKMHDATQAILWRPELNRFARMVLQNANGDWDVDGTIDASLAGLWLFGMYPVADAKMKATMEAIRGRLWVNTPIGGLARYEDDRYHQVSRDIEKVPGNPWIICTLWMAEWYAATAQKPQDLDAVVELLRWATDRALPSGVLAEQVDPYTGAPLSVSPLTWSHASLVLAVQAYLRARDRITHGR